MRGLTLKLPTSNWHRLIPRQHPCQISLESVENVNWQHPVSTAAPPFTGALSIPFPAGETRKSFR